MQDLFISIFAGLIYLLRGGTSMKFNIIDFLTNPFIPMFVATITGLFLGKIKIGKFSLGQSGALFTGILIGWALYSKYAVPFIDDNDPNHGPLKNAPQYAVAWIKNGVVSNDFFTFTLILFVASVGLLAGKDLIKVVKKYGVKFMILSAVITGTGAVVTYLGTLIFKGQNHFAVAGVYTGALTSSPGLAAALESVAKYGKEAQAQVGLGHAIGYAPGVLMIIFAMNLLPVIFRIDIDKEIERFNHEIGEFEDKVVKETTIKEVGMDVVSFITVCLVGYVIGSIKIYLPFVKWVSLGSTGGVLIMALVLGHIGKIGPLTFRIDNKVLSAIKDVSLSLFLAIVGLQYGYETINSLAGSGVILVVISFVVKMMAMLAGYLVGRYVFKMNWIILAGAMCGGATSTPGLAVAIDATKTNQVANGYGAAYPFGLIFKIIFVIMLHTFTY